MDRLSAIQCRQNAETKGLWDQFEPHRRRISEELARGFDPRAATLLVLGAGNTNDLDLGLLSQHFARITLADLDRAAVAAGIIKQSSADRSKIIIHPRIDLTGVLDLMASSSPAAISDAEIDAWLTQLAQGPVPPMDQQFDMVGSTCVLTQLIDAVGQTLGNSHPRADELALAIRDRHVQLLIDLVKPGGAGLLASDFVSSVTAPQLDGLSEDEFPAAMRSLIEARNFFTGVNPFVIEQKFREQLAPNGPLLDVQLIRPWRWNAGGRCFAVTAIKFLKGPA